jgi:hypothetical protein
MPRGDRSKYTGKQKRQVEHIEEGYEKKGVSKDEAERRAWARRSTRNQAAAKKAARARTLTGGLVDKTNIMDDLKNIV